MKYFSMFSGIGGFELGIGDLGECIGYSEIDKYAIKVYERHFKHKNYGDATTINTADLPDFDLLVGGFPCQAFSIAGNRRGFDDTRGTLFFDIARILKDKRPRYLVLENVKGLLTHDSGKTYQTILGVLADLGYRVEWQVLNSKNFGVPQNRERVLIVGHLGSEGRRQIFPITNPDQVGNPSASDSKEVHSIASTQTARQYASWNGNYIKVVGHVEGNAHEQIRRIHGIDGISPTVPTGTGGGHMPKVLIPHVKYGNGVRELTHTEGDIVPTIRASHYKSGDNNPKIITRSAAIRTRAYKGQPPQLEVRKDEISNTVDSVPKDFMAMQWRRSEKGKQARRESQKQGRDYTPFSDGHRELVPVDGKPVGTLTSQAVAKDSLLGDGVRIRRLTPIECERLQGFPDNWTKWGVINDSDALELGMISDSQRYKMCGNAVTTNVVHAVISRLFTNLAVGGV